MALGEQGGGDTMRWSAEHVVHPLETGPTIHWDLVHASAVSLPTCVQLPVASLPPFYLAGKETLLMLELKILESERKGSLIYLNSWGRA